MPVAEKAELITNAAGRVVPEMVNDRHQLPYMGVGKYHPGGRKASAPIRTAAEYPANGDKVRRRISKLPCANVACAMAWCCPRTTICAMATR